MGLENAEIAEATGVATKTVSMWMGGQEPKGLALLALARLFKVSPEWLLTGREPTGLPQDRGNETPRTPARPAKRKTDGGTA